MGCPRTPLIFPGFIKGNLSLQLRGKGCWWGPFRISRGPPPTLSAKGGQAGTQPVRGAHLGPFGQWLCTGPPGRLEPKECQGRSTAPGSVGWIVKGGGPTDSPSLSALPIKRRNLLIWVARPVMFRANSWLCTGANSWLCAQGSTPCGFGGAL